MKIQEITSFLEIVAPASLQESYDNAGLLTGDAGWDCTGIITTLDVTEEVVREAIKTGCNLVVAHHPVIFTGLKKITGRDHIEKTVIMAIKNDIAIYAIHTNLDNVLDGVNGMMADKLGLINRQALLPKAGLIKKLITFVPTEYLETLRNALFAAGAGHIGNYSEASFTAAGEGTFKAGENTHAFVGEKGRRHTEKETKLEMVFPAWIEKDVVKVLKATHPYEEVAYDIFTSGTLHHNVGSGLTGYLSAPMTEVEFLHLLKKTFGVIVVRHSPLNHAPVLKVALCGGAGSFLTGSAIAAGAQVYVTADVKYHEFFNANDRIVIADIGHYESEQYTIDLLNDILKEKFPNFAVRKTAVNTNPVNYFL